MGNLARVFTCAPTLSTVIGLALARSRTLLGPASAAKIWSVTNGIAKAKAKDSLRARRAAVRIRMTRFQIRMQPMPIRANLATGL
jgi:hypothetical protein